MEPKRRAQAAYAALRAYVLGRTVSLGRQEAADIVQDVWVAVEEAIGRGINARLDAQRAERPYEETWGDSLGGENIAGRDTDGRRRQPSAMRAQPTDDLATPQAIEDSTLQAIASVVRPPRQTPIDVAAVMALRGTGLSWSSIARRMGRDPSNLMRAVRERGVLPRGIKARPDPSSYPRGRRRIITPPESTNNNQTHQTNVR